MAKPLVAFLGTGLGFLGAYFLTKVADRKQKKRDKYIKQDLYNDRLIYMSQLIDVDIIKKQIGKLEKLSAEIEKVPTEYHKLELIASNDLMRLQKMDTVEVFTHIIILCLKVRKYQTIKTYIVRLTFYTWNLSNQLIL